MTHLNNDRGEQPRQDEVLKALEPLREVPARDAEQAAAGRAAFLEQARSMSAPVSAAPEVRHIRWTIFKRKERSPMTIIIRAVLALALVIAGAGTTAAAAQASSPSDALYPVKLMIEDVRLALTVEPQAEFDLLLSMVDERFEEIEDLSQEGEPIPARVTLRLQTQVQLALQHAARLDNGSLKQAMERMRVMTQEQNQALVQTQSNASENKDDALQLTEQILARIQAAAEEGLEDPIMFRLRHGQNRPEDAPEQPENIPPGESPGAGEGPQGPGGGETGGGAGGQGPKGPPTGE